MVALEHEVLPTWDQFMVPVLRVLSDRKVLSRRELYDLVARETRLTDEQRAEVLDSGERRFENRISWAITYIVKANAVMRPSRGQHMITESGRVLLEGHPNGLREADLRLIDGYDDGRKKHAHEAPSPSVSEALDPYELVEQGIARINSEVANNLLDRLHAQDPAFFEQAVVDLVVAMGYGGSDARATRTQLSNDGGIDGIIDQDVLGLSRVYLQAKRYSLDSSVQRPDIQSFVGALQGQQANQGVFITTGRFSSGAREYARSVPTRVVLIDGPRLAELMIRYRVGVQVKRTLQIVDIDEDFFE
ncbi:restriction endonuclease [Ferrimicrobium sp.]|uniref:restriction endonuclease n=1 Tax=Ferrimicrobium sp. TaxID=2926050 RepID=UPI002636708A|nr:restriction endonuclease [Ferrimicrobium sp.]